MMLLAWSVIALGAALLALAAFGVLKLPDALTRQHAATKAATLALGVMIAGLAMLEASAAWWTRLALLLVVLMLTVPLTSHALGRAAARADTLRSRHTTQPTKTGPPAGEE